MLAASISSSPLSPQNLRCEYHDNPLGIDVRQPRLSWVLKSSDGHLRGQKQTAYEILVASDGRLLTSEQADLWDSGKVESDQTSQIAYQGKPLSSFQHCYWTVRTWDEKGQLSDWSRAAHWSMGILEKADWKAKWIGDDTVPKPDPSDISHQLTLDKCKWIWANQGDATKDAAKGTCYFRKHFTISASTIQQAELLITADDECFVNVNGQKVGNQNDFHSAFALDLKPYLKPGHNVVAVSVNNGGGPAGLIARLMVRTEAPAPVVFQTDSSWKFSDKEQHNWEKPFFDDSEWASAKEIATAGDAPWGMPASLRLALDPVPWMRKGFAVDKPIARATLYASALGLYEMSLNGKRVGVLYFTPGWTDYHKRVYYNTYDVTGLMKSGENSLEALLGTGWYAGYVGFARRRQLYGPHPRLLAQLRLEFSDGTTQTIATDSSWQSAFGAIREADLLQGCFIDQRQRYESFHPVTVDETPAMTIQAYPGSPVTKHEELAAKKVTKTPDGAYVFDLGQNMVGWARLKVNVAPGTKLTVRHAEMLTADGTLYTTALRSARATDTYICTGGSQETLEPIFTFHGFRFVEVAGLPSQPPLDAVTGIVVGSNLNRTGNFECSNPLVNQLFHNIIWGQKGNYLEVPTDCPQRDERLGWMGDAQFFVPTGCYNFDPAAFFTKWMTDVEDAQRADGAYSDVSPTTPCAQGAGNTAWADAGIICNYTMYKFYGDAQIIRRHYDSMERYLAFLRNTAKNNTRDQGAYGDWLNLDGGAKSEVIGTAYYAHVNRIMAEMSLARGKERDAEFYNDIADKAQATFVRSFFNEDGSIKDSSQTGYALAFTMDLVPSHLKAKVADRFIEQIAGKDWHLATGFIGTPRLLPALSQAGRDDVAYRLLLTKTYPSWLYPVTLGATTMWERWNGWTPEKGFENPGMNSFNHYAFGSVGQWLYAYCAGIDADAPGFKRITIRPRINPNLKYASATYESIHGPISSSWRTLRDGLHLSIEIPPNTTAMIYVPAKARSLVRESNKLADDARDVRFVRTEAGCMVYEVGSGKYEFVSEL